MKNIDRRSKDVVLLVKQNRLVVDRLKIKFSIARFMSARCLPYTRSCAEMKKIMKEDGSGGFREEEKENHDLRRLFL